MNETEVIDKLFLELSQFTSARTRRELEYIEAIEKALRHLSPPSILNGPALQAVGVLEKVLGRRA